MYRYRELLMSLLASAMLTATLTPATGETSHAGIINPAGANRLLEAALSAATGAGMPPSAGYTAAAPETPPAMLVPVNQAPAAPVITPERMRVVNAYALRNVHTQDMDANVTEPLGLPRGVTHTTRQVITRRNDGSLTRVFAADANGSNTVIIVRVEATTGWAFRSDLNGTLIAAVRFANNAITSRDIRDADVRAAYDAELRHWATVVLPELPPQA